MTPRIPVDRQQEIIRMCVEREASARAVVDVIETSCCDEEGKEIEAMFASGVNYAMCGFPRQSSNGTPWSATFAMGYDAWRKISALG